MRVELARVLRSEAEFVEVFCPTDWFPDMPVPVAHDVLMDEHGNWSTVLRRVFIEDPPKVILQLTDVETERIEDWLTFHPDWQRRVAP